MPSGKATKPMNSWLAAGWDQIPSRCTPNGNVWKQNLTPSSLVSVVAVILRELSESDQGRLLRHSILRLPDESQERQLLPDVQHVRGLNYIHEFGMEFRRQLRQNAVRASDF